MRQRRASRLQSMDESRTERRRKIKLRFKDVHERLAARLLLPF